MSHPAFDVKVNNRRFYPTMGVGPHMRAGDIVRDAFTTETRTDALEYIAFIYNVDARRARQIAVAMRNKLRRIAG